jgi:Domain of unknown function (DUF4483)
MDDSEHCFYQNLKKTRNPLLLQSEVGRAKDCIRTLPPSDHAYGRKNEVSIENARSLLSYWEEHKPTKEIKVKKDYNKLNKLGVLSKITKPKQVKSFRDKNNIIFKTFKRKIDKSMHIYKGITYGISNRPSTPIKNVVEFEYGNKAKIQTHEIYLNERSIKSQTAKKKIRATPSPRLETMLIDLKKSKYLKNH